MTIQIHGVYEYDTGRTDYVHRTKIIYRIYVYKKIRSYYRCLIYQMGTEILIHEHVSKKFLRDECKFIGISCTDWVNLFHVHSEVRQ